jgi:hypothetical protein
LKYISKYNLNYKIELEEMRAKEFTNFQLEEYKNISNAHFEANKQIVIFFRYFLIIAAAPAAIFIWFGDSGNLLKNLLSSNDNIQLNIFVGLFPYINLNYWILILLLFDEYKF